MSTLHALQSGLLPALLGTPRARLALDYPSGTVTLARGETMKQIAAEAITDLSVSEGLLFSDLVLTIAGKVLTFKGFGATAARSFAKVVGHRSVLPVAIRKALALQSRISAVRASGHYLSQSRYNALVMPDEMDASALLHHLAIALKHGYAYHGPVDIQALHHDIEQLVTGDLRTQHNQGIIAKHERQYADLFARIEKTPLSKEQINAILTNEDRNLVVASAGSGKTSTIVGKVGYLLASGHSKPEEIITLAFARDAANELNQRLTKRLAGVMSPDQGIEASTFHSMGLAIIGQATGRRPDVCSAPDVMIDTCITDLCQSSARFNRLWNLFQAIYGRPVQTLPEFSSQEAYSSYLRACGARRKQGEALRIPTLKGDFVASMEEVLIANWLFCKGIDYQYEPPYPYVTADEQRRQYHPDFYFPQADIYLEHLGIDKNGQPAPFLGQAYLDSIKWKRELHRQKGTVLYESTSAMVRAGVIFDFLGSVLEKHGITPSPRSTDDIQSALADNNIKAQNNQRLVATFIHHLKSNELQPDDVLKSNKIASGTREDLFLSIIKEVLTEYNRRLRDLNQCDFDDMIVEATRYLREGKASLPYKVIIVDEFQDLAASRANLVKAALAQHSDGILFAVGDDWQAIYRFAGSDISAMTRFNEQFGSPALSMLTTTYRSNQGITDAAAAFIQKNPEQIRKVVSAYNKDRLGAIELVRCEQSSLIVDAVFAKISELVVATNKRPEVFILCRYNREMEPFINSPLYKELGQHASIKVMTFHTSKGLEADYVFIPGLNAGAFPSTIVDDPLLGLVMPDPEAFPMAEERRVFYVALTRARHKVYAYAEAGYESPFFLEIEAKTEPDIINRQILDRSGVTIQQINITWCKCCSGYMVSRIGKFGPFRGCSNYPDCTFTMDKHEGSTSGC